MFSKSKSKSKKIFEPVPLLASKSALSLPAQPLCPLTLLKESVKFFFVMQSCKADFKDPLEDLWLFQSDPLFFMSL